MCRPIPSAYHEDRGASPTSIRGQAVRCRSAAARSESCRGSCGADTAGSGTVTAKAAVLSLQSMAVVEGYLCIVVQKCCAYIIVHRKPVFNRFLLFPAVKHKKWPTNTNFSFFCEVHHGNISEADRI